MEKKPFEFVNCAVNSEIYKCGRCNAEFKYLDDLKTHKQSAHGEGLHYKCVRCDYASSCKENVMTHYLSTHPKKVNEFKCSVCNFKALRLRILESHYRFKHPGETPHKCGECGKSYRESSVLRRHRLMVHKKVKNVRCTLCDYRCFDKGSLSSHLSVHSGEKPHVCDECGVKFSKKGLLKTHKLDVHQRVKRFKCALCNYCTYHKSSLKLHVLTHSGEKSHKCDHCDKMFSNIYTLNRHKSLPVRKEKKRLKCSLCDYQTYRECYLQNHLLVHTGEKKHMCDECGKMFSLASRVHVHKLSVHRKEKRFKCSFCDYESFAKGNLRAHLLVHRKDKHYECGDCGKSYATAIAFKEHHLTVHKGGKLFKCYLCDFITLHRSSMRKHKIVHNKIKTPKNEENKISTVE